MFRQQTILLNLAFTFFSVMFSERQVNARANRFDIPAGVITLTTSTTPTTCSKTNGSIVASASGGVPPYTYSYTISGNTQVQNTGNFQNLAAGSYTVIATDASGKTDTAIVDVTNNSTAPSAKVTLFTDPSTCATFDGSLTISASNGTPPYEYSFDNVNYQPANVFTNLTQGLYSIFVKDANGCISENYTNYLYPKVSCFGIGFYYSNFECNNNGTLTVGTVLGGVPPFVYSIDGINYQADNKFYNIGAGVHHMYTKDATGVVSIYTVTSSPLCPINVSYVATDASCNKGDAILTLSPAYGTGPYAYTLDGINYQPGNTFSNLLAGNYTFTVKDANGVTFSGYATIKSKCPVVFAAQTDPTCGRQDGTINATGYNGTLPYQFSIDGINFQTNNLFTGLAAGNYTVTIKDADGFIDTTVVTLSSNCLLLNINITNTVCGNASGAINVSASSGTPPYEYSLDGSNYQQGTSFIGLRAGMYTVYAKDAASATADSSITITDVPGPGESVIITQGSCGNPKGNLNIIATGGTPPIQYSIDGTHYESSAAFDNLDSGRYITYVKDANGCVTTDTVEIVPKGCGILLPNAFSPNGDGLNDIFRVKYPFAVRAFSLTVYNRLGEKIFETSDMTKGWDGTFKGVKQPMDIYVWVVQLTSPNNIEQKVKGIVTLLK